MGGLWTQKRVKTRGFLRCLKRLFKAHDGPLGLILVSLVNLFGIFCKNPGPFWVSLLAFVVSYVGSRATLKKKWTIFGSFFEHFWEPFWGPFWDQIGQRGGKMSPREPSGASKSQKAAFSKTLKNLQFLKVFGSRGLPREPQETQEGSQEEPKELQNPQQKDPKLNPKINNF